jgi:hypoxanthine phosphoribosyltransferase
MHLEEAPLLAAEDIHRRVAELARTISGDYAGRRLLVIVGLKGGLVFAADLIRGLTVPVSIDFIRARSYDQTQSTGRLTLTLLPEQPLADKHVLLVEDIIDSGRTVHAMLEHLREGRPASLALCALLDKPAHRVVSFPVDYVGFAIGDHFDVGYGLDYKECGRELPAIYVFKSP